MSYIRRIKAVSTTDAAATVIDSHTVPDNTTIIFEVKAAAHCTGGAGGNAGSGAGFWTLATYKRAGAGPVIVGAASVPNNMPQLDAGVAGITVAFGITGNAIDVVVTGGATDNINWKSFLTVRALL